MKTLLLSIALLYTVNLNAQNVNIPDWNFKGYLVGNLAINTNADTEIQLTEANSFTGEIDCSTMSIFDLTGIEEFTSLTSLKCYENMLTGLDVSQNTSLDTLYCWTNQITSLNVTNNTNLIHLVVGNNPITTLDVSQNTAVTLLIVGSCQLTSIDVTQNTAMTELHCQYNQLASLDLSQNSALTLLYCGVNQLTSLNVANGNNTNVTIMNISSNPNLTCVQVDDVAYSTTNWTNIDPGASYSLDCSAGIEELTQGTVELLKITDLMGRETSYKPNTPLIYIYSDGTTERVFKLEE